MATSGTVERCRPVVRQAHGARSVEMDGYGRILGGACGLSHQRSALGPNVGGSTLRAQLGDWLGCLSLAALLGLLARTWFSSRFVLDEPEAAEASRRPG